MEKLLTPEVRTWLYGVSVALIPLLVTVGVLAGDVAQQVLSLVAAFLGLGNAGLATAYRPTRKPEEYEGTEF
ncbi:phage holin [Trueperella pyogenes]